jgi:aryl-alcohol dehydrogenase-like predicted oxidoreductase
VPWDGCVHVTDPASQAWLRRANLALLPWSSQARGFFAGRDDAEVARCYHSDANTARRERATALAAELGVPATAVALAYVLHQPFPTFPLIGPRTLTETHGSLRALEVALTPDQVAWLANG